MNRYKHPAVEPATIEITEGCRLALASGTVRSFLDLAVDTARAKLPADEHCCVDNATGLAAVLTC
ncbi:hypothetical protein ACWDV7_08565 [Streptomyces sp. NPDC003362]